MATTEGEETFERLLTGRGIDFDYEQASGSKKPDYLVHRDIDAICEVKDFGPGKLDVKIATGRWRGGAWDPIPALQTKVKRARGQLSHEKGVRPCVIVIYNPGYMPYDRDLFMRLAVGKDRLFTKTQNTRVSAVAVLDMTHPNRKLIDDAIGAKFQPIPKDAPDRRDQLALALEESCKIEEELRQTHGDEFIDKELLQLRIYHNPHAAVALPPAFFGGPPDVYVTLDTLWNNT